MSPRTSRSRARAIALGALFALSPVTAHADAAVDPRSLAPLLRIYEFAELEAGLADLERSGARTREGWLAFPRALAALGIASADDPALATSLDAWRDGSPDRWVVEMVSGWRQLELGHAPRAIDASFDVPRVPDQPDPALRAAARSAFERAHALAPRSPEPYTALLAVASMEHAPMPERLALLAKACAVDATCETARATLLVGSEDDADAASLLELARTSARAHPDDPNLGLLVGIAHRRAGIASGDPVGYFQRAGVFDEVERAYATYLAAHPDAFLHWNEYALLACWAGRRDTARRAFEAIGDGFRAEPWKGDFRAFADRRQVALGRPLTP